MSASIVQTGSATSDSVFSIARARLEHIVAQGARNARPVVERVLSEVPEDKIVRASALDFYVDPREGLYLGTGSLLPTHRHAFHQVVSRAGIPNAYADGLAVPDEDATSNEWRRELLAHTLRQHYQHDTSRYLLRTVNGQARGFLSDSYRRLDSRPLLEAFIGTCNELGAIPFEGVANDVRSSVRAIFPQVIEPVPGEAMVFGISWHNSDFGAGTYSLSAFVLRLVCLNGALGESALKQIHLGGRLPDDLELSQRTYQLDTCTMISTTKDVVRAFLSPKAISERCDKVRRAHETEGSFAGAFKKLRTLTKAEQKSAQEAFEGPDVINLPPGQTLWRFSNALSWIANGAEDPERKLELQRVAGSVLP